MYQVQDSVALLRARRGFAAARKTGRPFVAKTVLLLGLTSLSTDISSEMVSAILPLYTVQVLGLNPLSYGVLNGIYQGGSAFARLIFGSSPTGWSATARSPASATGCRPSASSACWRRPRSAASPPCC